jgi:hypothetical protein
VSFVSSGPLKKPNDVYNVADAMGARGWQFARCQNPICCLVQVCFVVSIEFANLVAEKTKVGAKASFDAEAFLADLKSCVEEVLAEPGKYGEGMAKVYGKRILRVFCRFTVINALNKPYHCFPNQLLGMAASVPDRSIVDDLLKSYVDAVYT